VADVIAFDSKTFERGIIAPFRTPLCAAVELTDIDTFQSEYDSSLIRIKEEYGIKRGTTCLTYRDFAKVLRRTNALEPIRETLEAIEESISRITFYYVLTRLDEVKIYGKQSPEVVDRARFIDILSPYFVLASAWKFLDSREEDCDKLVMDHFQCDIVGGAPSVLTNNPRIHIRGDECNRLISCADLAVGLFDLELERRNWRIDETDPTQLLPNSKIEVFFEPITTKDFHAITPLERRQLDLGRHIEHPIVFFIAEPHPDELSGVTRDEFFDRFLYDNPVWHRTLNLACDLNGSTKLIEPHQDLEIIKDGDILVHTGPSGKKLANFFQGYCPNSLVLKSKDLFDESKIDEIRERYIDS